MANIARLKAMQHMLEHHHEIFPDVIFYMGSWVEKLACGYAACAVGSACAYPPFRKEGLGIKRILCTSDLRTTFWPTYQNSRSWTAVEKFFGLSFNECEFLFCRTQYPPSATPKMVAERIAQFIQIAGA